MGKVISQYRSTLVGLGALLMWALEPLLVSEINRLPIFELLSIIFFSSFVMTAVRITKKRLWGQIAQVPAYVWAVGVIGICVSDFAYIFGSQYGPIAHIELIDYLWPSFVILFTSLLPNEKLQARYVVGALLGFIGITILVQGEIFAESFNPSYLIGYGFALFGAAIWGGYCAFSRHHKRVPTEMIGIYCGIGSVICALLHLQCETFVMPTVSEGSLAVVTGVTGAGIAYQLWDYGVKHGNVYLLGVLTYVARLLGMALLVLCGKEPLTLGLIIACGLGTLGVLVSTTDLKLFNPLYVIQYFRYGKKLPIHDDIEMAEG